jgi:hypothetical protein
MSSFLIILARSITEVAFDCTRNGLAVSETYNFSRYQLRILAIYGSVELAPMVPQIA